MRTSTSTARTTRRSRAPERAGPTATDTEVAQFTAFTPKAEIILVTPQMAQAWLDANPNNRPLRKRVVAKYARDMRSGNWKMNGEAIIKDTAGRLMDGQHRLRAVIEAGIAVPMLLVVGVAPDAMSTIDTGASRTYGDVLSLRGFPANQARAIAAGARLWYLYDRESFATNSDINPSSAELDGVIDEFGAELALAAEMVAGSRTVKRFCVPSVQTFVVARGLTKADESVVRGYMQRLNDGAGLTKDDAIYHLRRRLVEKNTIHSGQRERPEMVLALSIKSLVAFANGRPVAKLFWNPERESFPAFDLPRTV